MFIRFVNHAMTVTIYAYAVVPLRRKTPPGASRPVVRVMAFLFTRTVYPLVFTARVLIFCPASSSHVHPQSKGITVI